MIRPISPLILRCGIVVALFCLPLGCGGNNEKTPKPATPAEHFNGTQGGTMTPDGEVVPNSAKDTGDGRIIYETKNGGKFEAVAKPTKTGFKWDNIKRVPN